MTFLVDANVLSEPTKLLPSPSVCRWLKENEASLCVNPVIAGEVEFGILRLPAGRRRTNLLNWFAGGIARMELVEMDRATAQVWAKLLADLKRRGRAMPLKDSLIAATALQHGFVVATRNTADYQHARCKLIDPFRG